jgi:MFS family permease
VARAQKRAFAGVFAATLLAFIAIGAALPVLPTYVRGPLHGSNLAVGVVVGAFSITSVFCRPLAGRLADRRGRRIVLILGALAMALGGLLYILAVNVPELIGARLVVGMGEGSLYTAGAAWAVDLMPPERYGFALGVFGLGVWGGLSLGPICGELLRSGAGYQAVWILAAALPFAGMLIACLLPRTAPPAVVGAPAPFRMFPRPARRPGAALALANFGYAALAGFVVLDLRQHGVAGGASVFTAFAVAVFSSRLALSRVPDRAGARATATAAALTEALGLAVIALAGSLSAAIAGALIMGVGFSMLFPSLALMVVGEVGADSRGSALGAFTAFFDIGVGLGAPLAGAIASLAGYPAVFMAAAAGALLAASVAAFPRERRLSARLAAARMQR